MKKAAKGQRKSLKDKYLSLTVSLLLFFAVANGQQITYVPFSSAGSAVKYLRTDSGIAVPFRNLTTGRGTDRPGALVCNTADSLLYYWNGVRWVGPLNTATGGGGTFIGVDSVTYSGGFICQWKSGAPTCYPVIPGVDSVVITGNQLCQWKGGIPICYTINGNVLASGIDSVIVSGNTLCQWKGGTPTCYTINNVSHGLDSLTVTDSLICTWTGGVSTCFVIQDTVFLADDLVNRGRTATGKQIIGRLHDDGYTGGIVSGASCMSLGVTPVDYYIGGIHFLTAQTTITIPNADPFLNRTDLIVVDTNGVVSSITGVPAINPTLPQVNPGAQLVLTSIFIPAGATCLPINTGVIYNENVEWPTGHTGTMGVDFNNTANPFTGVKAAFVQTYTDGSSLTFTDTGTDTAKNGEILKLFIYTNNAFLQQDGVFRAFQFQLFNGSTPVTNNLIIQRGFGFFNTDSAHYQNVSIPFSVFTFTGTVFNKLVIKMSGSDVSGAGGYYVDYIQLQTGIAQQSKTYVDSVTIIHGASDSDYYWKNGFKTLIGPRSSGSSISLTTTGSGAATLISNVLNIPTPSIPAQFNPIAGTNVTISGSYPNITFNATSGGGSNLNIGSGFRFAVPGTNNIKTIFNGYAIGIDSASNTNALTLKADTSLLLTKLGAAAIYLTANQTISFAPTGDVTGSTTGTTSLAPVFAIGNNKVTNAMLAQMAGHTYKGNNTGSTANAADITNTQLTADLNVFTSSLKGLVPSGGTIGKVLHGDGNWYDTTAAGSSSGWALTGNTGTNSGLNFIGTTDLKSLVFKTNAITALSIDSLQVSNFSDTGSSQIVIHRTGSLTENGKFFMGDWGAFVTQNPNDNVYIRRITGVMQLYRNMTETAADPTLSLEHNGTGALIEVGNSGIGLYTLPSGTAGTHGLIRNLLAATNGNVGIGPVNLTPPYKLAVEDTLNSSVRADVSNVKLGTAAAATLSTTSDLGSFIFQSFSSIYSSTGPRNAGGAEIVTGGSFTGDFVIDAGGANENLSFWAGNVQGMMINGTTRDVLIGTTSDLAPLTVAGSASIPLISGGNTTTSTLIIEPTTGAGAATSDIVFKTNTQNEVFRLRSGAVTKATFTGGTFTDQASILSITGTYPSTITGVTPAFDISLTGAGSSALQQEVGQRIVLAAGYTGTGSDLGLQIVNNSAGTGTGAGTTSGNISYRPSGNQAAQLRMEATTTGNNIGGTYLVGGGGINIAAWLASTAAKNSATNVGVLAFGSNTGTSPIEVGVGAFLGDYGTSLPTLVSAALLVDNKDHAVPIAIFRDNGTVVFSIADGGNPTLALANKLIIGEGTNGSVGQTTLVAGTKAISITGVTTSTRAIVTLVSQGGTVTTTINYAAVCTSGTLTITALTSAGATDTTDTSVLNYIIIN